MTIQQATDVLNKHLPATCHRKVWIRNGYGGPTLCILFAASDHKISNVSGQYPMCVSLWVNDDVLQPQIFGGMGGRRIYFNTDPNNPDHRYFALQGVNIPFRKGKPSANEKQLARFCNKWVQTIKDHAEFINYDKPADYESILNFDSPKVA